jgi:hypothetical protein
MSTVYTQASVSLDGFIAGPGRSRLFDWCTGAVVVGLSRADQPGVPAFLVTHWPPAGWVDDGTPYTFVTDGVQNAVARARAVAGVKAVCVGPGSTVGQALQAGLIDEVRVDLVPVLLGGGTPMFDLPAGDAQPVSFGDPEVIEGVGVTPLVYRRA